MTSAIEKPFFLPRLCPECQAILSPAEKPAPGDVAQCQFCGTWLVFDADLVLKHRDQ